MKSSSNFHNADQNYTSETRKKKELLKKRGQEEDREET